MLGPDLNPSLACRFCSGSWVTFPISTSYAAAHSHFLCSEWYRWISLFLYITCPWKHVAKFSAWKLSSRPAYNNCFHKMQLWKISLWQSFKQSCWWENLHRYLGIADQRATDHFLILSQTIKQAFPFPKNPPPSNKPGQEVSLQSEPSLHLKQKIKRFFSVPTSQLNWVQRASQAAQYCPQLHSFPLSPSLLRKHYCRGSLNQKSRYLPWMPASCEQDGRVGW